MKIVETDILDVTRENLDYQKIEFSNKILRFIRPLLEESYFKSLSEVKQLKSEISVRKESIKKEKEDLSKIVSDYSRNKKISILLEHIMNLVNIRVPEGSTKRELVVLLKVVEKLSDEKIDSFTKRLMKKS